MRLPTSRDSGLSGGSRSRFLYLTVRRVIEMLSQEGPLSLLRRTVRKLRLAHWEWGVLVTSEGVRQDLNARYQVWLQRHRLTPADVEGMIAALDTLNYSPCISIATPVYNTDEVWLRKAIDSVRAQVYPHWELCLVTKG